MATVRLDQARAALDRAAVGEQMHALIAELFPICRSITGDGVRATLARLGRHLPLRVHEVPSGTRVLDWTVPPEWNLRDAWVKDARGERVIDVRASSLHVVSYSVPVRARMSLAALRPHLHTLPGQPDLIPYRTSYYKPAWGFCLPHRRLLELPDGEYEVCIDASLAPGSLTYGEVVLPGETEDEVLLSTHVCHPSLANDNLSGVAVATYAAMTLARAARRHSYRILFVPGTIGAITWLARNEPRAARIAHGLVLAGLGDGGRLTYKQSRRGNARVDRAAAVALRGREHEVVDFAPWGYDERQYCSPGFDLPVGCLMRTPQGGYPEYHTSADDLALVRPAALADSLDACLAILAALEVDRTYVNLAPKGEPQLGRRGLYGDVGGAGQTAVDELALLWMLNLSDGRHALLDVADRSGLEPARLHDAASALARHGLLRESPGATRPARRRPRRPGERWMSS